MKKTGVAIIGMGTVGTGVARLLVKNNDRIAKHAGCRLSLAHVVVSDLNRPRDFELSKDVLTADLDRVLNDKTVSLVAQLVGGVSDAREIMLKLLSSGKDVVTANKALLAEHGPELFEHARQNHRSIGFEASVCGGIPIVATIAQCFSANQILSLHGILNGTSNYIVSQMDEHGTDYDTAVIEAQRLGYAEADPTFDVDGSDSAQKLSILARIGFGTNVQWKDISRRGIDSIDSRDFRFARQMGYRIKLIAFAKLRAGGLQMSVAPMLTKIGRPLAEVRENFNAVSVVGDVVGPVFLHGQGAGQMPTSSAVVADMIDTAVGRTAITFNALELWADNSANTSVDEPGNLEGRFYLRFNVDDQPGVLARIAGVLGQFGISIASVYQHESSHVESSAVPVVIMTQVAPEKSAQQAVNMIANMDCVRPNFERLRILE